MHRRGVLSLVSSLVALTLGTFVHSTTFALETAFASATMYVDPRMSIEETGENFTMSIDVSIVADLYGWELKLVWNATILDAVGIREGAFLKGGGDTFFTYKVFNAGGYILIDCTLLGSTPGVTGNGTLATIEFHVEEVGECTLDLNDTVLVNSLEQPIDHDAVDGYCYAVPSEPFHDVAVQDAVPSKSVVGEGFPVYINVTLLNKGTFLETFNVSVSYDGFPVILPNGEDHVTVILAAQDSTITAFTWNTTTTPKGDYTLSAYATPVPDETDVANNNFTDGHVIVAMIGDIYGPNGLPDGKVDIRDVAAVAKHFGVDYPDPEYNPNFDVVYDLKIDIKDIATVARHFGEIDP